MFFRKKECVLIMVWRTILDVHFLLVLISSLAVAEIRGVNLVLACGRYPWLHSNSVWMQMQTYSQVLNLSLERTCESIVSVCNTRLGITNFFLNLASTEYTSSSFVYLAVEVLDPNKHPGFWILAGKPNVLHMWLRLSIWNYHDVSFCFFGTLLLRW